jgi:hypothetical protein
MSFEDECPDCGAECFPVDLLDCDRASMICPQCAPQWILARSTSEVGTEGIDSQWKDRY